MLDKKRERAEAEEWDSVVAAGPVSRSIGSVRSASWSAYAGLAHLLVSLDKLRITMSRSEQLRS
eukprot:3639301-Prymnesium_polylepis.1